MTGIKSTRRRCGVCGCNGSHHDRSDTGRVVWCDPSEGAMWPTAALLAKAVRAGNISAAEAKTLRELPRLLTDAQSDWWAIRCGLHPQNVWPGWCDAGLRYTDRVFVESGWRHAWLHLGTALEQAA